MTICTKRNPIPPCVDGYYESKNKKGNICCYKEPKKKYTKKNTEKLVKKVNSNISNISNNSLTDNLLDKFYIFRENLTYHLINYQDTNINDILIKDKVKSYHYNELNIEQNNNNRENNNLIKLDKKIESKTKEQITRVVHDYARGVKNYINKMSNNDTVTNAVTKLWEIYQNFPNIIPYKGDFNVFHMAEAPGQWINCTRNFINQKRKNINYNWLANTLKSNDKSDIDPLEDEYGLIRNNPDKWLFGRDGTGDITKHKNILSFREDTQKIFNGRINLVTGDAGTKNVPLNIYQKIDYSQMATVIATCGINGNCVIKHFLPYINEFPISSKAGGFFINYIYCYYILFREVILFKPQTSNPSSTEFYLIGLSYKGCSDSIMNKIIKKCDNFKENECIFNKEDISDKFSKQIIDFINSMYKIVNDYIKTQYLLNLSYINSNLNHNNVILTNNFKNTVLNKRYNKWLHQNKFNYKSYTNNRLKKTNQYNIIRK